MAECTTEKPGSRESVPAGISGVAAPATRAEYPVGKPSSTESIPAGVTSDAPPHKVIPAESTDTGPAPEEKTGKVSAPFANIVIKSTFTDTVFGERGASAAGTIPESASVADPAVKAIQEESIPEENARQRISWSPCPAARAVQRYPERQNSAGTVAQQSAQPPRQKVPRQLCPASVAVQGYPAGKSSAEVVVPRSVTHSQQKALLYHPGLRLRGTTIPSITVPGRQQNPLST